MVTSASLHEFLVIQKQSTCSPPQLELSTVRGIFGTLSDIYILAIPIIPRLGLRLLIPYRIGLCAVLLVELLYEASSLSFLWFLKSTYIDLSGHLVTILPPCTSVSSNKSRLFSHGIPRGVILGYGN